MSIRSKFLILLPVHKDSIESLFSSSDFKFLFSLFSLSTKRPFGNEESKAKKFHFYQKKIKRNDTKNTYGAGDRTKIKQLGKENYLKVKEQIENSS
jgi:hypothetical protein